MLWYVTIWCFDDDGEREAEIQFQFEKLEDALQQVQVEAANLVSNHRIELHRD